MEDIKIQVKGLIEESDAAQESGRKIETLKGILNLLLSDEKNTKENIKERELVSTDSVDYQVSLSVESETDGEKSEGSKEDGEIRKIEGEEASRNTQDGEGTKDS